MTSRYSFDELSKYIKQIEREFEVNNDDPIGIVVAANFCEELEENRYCVSEKEGKEFVQTISTELENMIHCKYFNVSAKHNINVDEVFYELARMHQDQRGCTMW